MTNHLAKDRRTPFRSEFLVWMCGFSVTFQNNRLGSIDIVLDKSRQLCSEPTFPRRFLPGTKGSLRRVESMQRLHASVELKHKRAICSLAENLIEKRGARSAFLLQHFSLTPACIDQKSNGQGQVCFLGEVSAPF